VRVQRVWLSGPWWVGSCVGACENMCTEKATSTSTLLARPSSFQVIGNRTVVDLTNDYNGNAACCPARLPLRLCCRRARARGLARAAAVLAWPPCFARPPRSRRRPACTAVLFAPPPCSLAAPLACTSGCAAAPLALPPRSRRRRVRTAALLVLPPCSLAARSPVSPPRSRRRPLTAARRPAGLPPRSRPPDTTPTTPARLQFVDFTCPPSSSSCAYYDHRRRR
jgi:hypothetical protein